MIFNAFGILLCVLSLISILPAAADGIGVIFLLFILVLAGLTALSGKIKYGLIVFTISSVFIAFYTLNLLGWSPFSHENEPLPAGIAKIEDLQPFSLQDRELLAKEVSKQTGIPFEDLINAEVVDNQVDKRPSKMSQAFYFLKFVSIPYSLAVFLILIGFRIGKRQADSASLK